MTDTKQHGLDQRELLIEAILGVRTPDGKARVGIWGREVCQVCGELGDYVGHWPAVTSHMSGQFNCRAHEHAGEELPPKPWTTRHCEVCRRVRAVEDMRQAAHRWICAGCDLPGSSEEDLSERLQRVVSARFLDARCPDELSLVGWLNRQYAMAEGLKRVFDGGGHVDEVTELDEARRLLGELAESLGDVAESLRARDLDEGDDAAER